MNIKKNKMGRIATWQYVNDLCNTNGSPLTKCPTYDEINAELTTLISGGNYTSLQCVQEEHISYYEPRRDNFIEFNRQGHYNAIYWFADYELTSDVRIFLQYINSSEEIINVQITLPCGMINDYLYIEEGIISIYDVYIIAPEKDYNYFYFTSIGGEYQ